MSGIVAAAQSSGCCCRPQQGCTCSNPNRPGAIIDRGLTSIAIESQFGYDEAELNTKTDTCGCECFASPGAFKYGPNGGTQYAYAGNGSAVDPDFSDGTPCESVACRGGGCSGCPVWRVSAEFGTVVAEAQPQLQSMKWRTVIRQPLDHVVASWNWRPRMVGYCQQDPASGYPDLRIRRVCGFSRIGNPIGTSLDPYGQYIDVTTGEYTGANIGPLNVYAGAEILAPANTPGGPSNCDYIARISLTEFFLSPLIEQLAAEGSIVLGGILEYRKPCLSPTDTVLGTYRLAGNPSDWYSDTYFEDQSCGPTAHFRDLRYTVPTTLRIS